ncbi:MAG: AMP-binding protein [Gammaproteobacteria bacterium]
MTHSVHRIAAARGDVPALVDERGVTGWQTLDQRTNRLIHALRELGLKPGDVIAVYAGNCREYYEIMLAANHAGIIYVPVNWHFSAEELAYVIDNSGARVLFTEGTFAETAAAALARGETPGLAHAFAIRAPGTDGFGDYEHLLAGASDAEPEGQCAGGPMFYTSGTTGRPKGVRSTTSKPGGPLMCWR